jgi:uncharacterized protein (TIGR00369 family)
VTFLHDPSLGRSIARFVGVDMREVGDFEAGEIAVEGTIVVHPHLADPDGNLRAGALLTISDNIAGLTCGLGALPDGWVVTTNLMLRIAATAHVDDTLLARSRVLRRGKAAVVADLDMRDEHGARVAAGMLTSAVLVPEGGPPHWARPAQMQHAREADAPDLPPLYEWLDVQRADGGASLTVFDELRNPWGIVHGGVTAALVDAAATSVAGGTTRDAVVHYLAPNRVGPVRADATVIGSRPDGTVVRVEVRDTGNDERLTALAVVTVSPV